MHTCIVKVCILVTTLVLAASVAVAGDKLERLRIAGPAAAISFPLVQMIDTGALAHLAETVEFVSWRDPDQVRAMLLRGEVDFVALPSNVAANLYNRGVNLRLINIAAWGLLWLVSSDGDVDEFGDLVGDEIVVPFRGDIPDILLTELLHQHGIDPRADVRLRYVATPMDAMQLIIMRRARHAVLMEPAASMAIERTSSGMTGMVAPTLYRAIDLQAEWGAVFERPPRIPQAGMVAVGELPDALIEAFTAAYAQALATILADPERAAAAMVAALPMLTKTGVIESIAHSRLQAVPAYRARAELEFFYRILEQRSPALIGGGLPDDGFYHAGGQ